jgi:membrane-bound serine protease (ClpP class)
MVLPQFMSWLANPDVAYVLFVIGLLGLVGEVVAPGATFPGITGAICLVLGLVGLGQLPTDWGGAALIIVAVVMFLIDLKIPGHALSVGGVAAFAIGSLLLFTPFWAVSPEKTAPYLSPWVILTMTVGVGAFFILGAAAGLAAQSRPVAVGRETLVGKVGVVRRALNPEGIVHVEGEEWSARPASRFDGHTVIPVGAQVRVVSSEGLLLRVVPEVAPDTSGVTVVDVPSEPVPSATESRSA